MVGLFIAVALSIELFSLLGSVLLAQGTSAIGAIRDARVDSIMRLVMSMLGIGSRLPVQRRVRLHAVLPVACCPRWAVVAALIGVVSTAPGLREAVPVVVTCQGVGT